MHNAPWSTMGVSRFGGRRRWSAIRPADMLAWAVVMAACVPGAEAATLYWSGTASTNWSNTSAWTSSATSQSTPAAVPVITDDVIFNADAFNADTKTVSLNSNNRAALSLLFKSSGTTTIIRASSTNSTGQSLTVGGGGITVNAGAGPVSFGQTDNKVNVKLTTSSALTNNSSSLVRFFQTIEPASTAPVGNTTLTISGSGTGGVQIDDVVGNSTATITLGLIVNSAAEAVTHLKASNTFTGGVTLTEGVLGVGSSQALGTNAVTVNGGAVASMTIARTLANNFTIGGNFKLGGQGQPITLDGSINLGAAIRTITLGNSATINGVISDGGLVISGSSGGGNRRLTLGGTNTYALGTTVSSGTLVASSTGAFGSGTVTVASGAALDLGAQAIGNAITNNGGSILNAASFIGTQSLSGASTFGALGGGLTVGSGGIATLQALASGSITVNSGGKLLLDSTGTAGGGVLVNAGGFLGGTGNVTGGLTVGGTLSPGASPGLVSVSTLALQSTASTVIEVAGTVRGTGYDAIDIATAAGLTYGGELALSFTSGTFPDQTSFNVFNFTGAAAGEFTSVVAAGAYGSPTFAEVGTTGVWEAFPSNGQTLRFTESTGVVAVVPEPSTWVLMATAVAAVGLRCRRRGGKTTR